MPPLEAWEKVYISLGNKESPGQLDQHLLWLTCVDCHGGNPAETAEHHAAHEGMVPDPSGIETDACGDCHDTYVKGFAQSFHFSLKGELTAIATRAGADSFEQCPESLKEGHAGECARCHATCGDCHVSRPDSVGKGFIKNHIFAKKPHQKNQCMACHGSRIAFDFMGDSDAGRAPDVHFAKGKDCMFCHNGTEMHSPAGEARDRYHYDKAPTCEGCHAVPHANVYHDMHWDDLSCQVCHSQPYNNCTACHVGGAWETDPEYTENNPALGFRIGLSPITERRFKYAVLRHTPVAPDSYDNWGEAGLLADYAALPTWKYATPHSIRRWTDRTEAEEGESCASRCHPGGYMGNPENKALFLFEQEVEENWPAEVEANSTVTVDGQLPDGWE